MPQGLLPYNINSSQKLYYLINSSGKDLPIHFYTINPNSCSLYLIHYQASILVDYKTYLTPFHHLSSHYKILLEKSRKCLFLTGTCPAFRMTYAVVKEGSLLSKKIEVI
jgi:hypothetical protein